MDHTFDAPSEAKKATVPSEQNISPAAISPVESINLFAKEQGIPFVMNDITPRLTDPELGDGFIAVEMLPLDPEQAVGSEQYDAIAQMQFKMLAIAKESPGGKKVYFKVDAPKAKLDTSGTKFMGIAQQLDRDPNFGWEVIVAESFVAKIGLGSAMELFKKFYHLNKFSTVSSEEEAIQHIIKAIKSAPKMISSF